MGHQATQIANCISAQYCCVKKLECVGRDATQATILLKKLLLAKWITSVCADEDISCFLKKYCRC